ncbi:MAG: hypothetical protein ACYCWW_09560 [Deltaproteobacteria bacterium]
MDRRPMTRFLCRTLLAFAGLALSSSAARADTPGCTFTVNPTVTISETTPQLHYLTLPKFTFQWATGTQGNCSTNWENIAGVMTTFTDNATRPTNCGEGVDNGDQVTSGMATISCNLSGSKITASVSADCWDPVQNTGNVVAQGNTIVVPPFLLNGLTAVAPLDPTVFPADQQWPDYQGDPTAIPLGYGFHVNGIVDNLVEGESLRIVASGAGVAFDRSYLASDDDGGVLVDPATAWLYDNDPASLLVPTQVGTIQIYVAFDGTQSATRTLTVVNSPAASSSSGSAGSGSGGSGSGGSTGGGTGGGNPPSAGKAGCGTSGGVGLLALVASAAFLARRRRRPARA